MNESESLLRRQARFFDLSDDLHALATFDGRFVTVNAAWARTLGWSREELLSKPFLALVHPDDVEATQREAASMFERGSTRFTNRYRTKSGEWRWLEWVSEPRVDEDLIYASARDITDRRAAEEALRESETRYRLLLDNLPGTLVVKTDRALTCKYMGGGGAAKAGLDPADYVGAPMHEIYAPYGPMRAELLELHREALEGRSGRTTLRSPVSGEHYDVAFVALPGDDGVVGTMVVATNVTGAVAHQREVDRLGKGFEQMIDYSPIGMALVGLDGRWLQVNPALCEIVGYSEHRLLGMTFQDLTHPDDLDLDLALLKELSDGERQSYEMEKRYIRDDGSMVWVLLTVSLMRDESGRPLHYLSQILDITERKAEQSKLRTEAEGDPLTNALNRRRFKEVLTDALAGARHRSQPSALLFLDLDEFKAINDRYGHDVGDRLLRSVADTVSGRLRGTDVLGRQGGDEFVVLLDRVGEPQARSIAAELGAAIASIEVESDLGPVRIAASVGVAMLDGRSLPTAELALNEADRAMYRDKRG